LVEDASRTDDEALVGTVCHIVAQENKGPRGDDPLPAEDRSHYGNLILLCGRHHSLVDRQPNTYSVMALGEMKRAHEQWVRESLVQFDPAKQRDEELYADIVEEWGRRVDLDGWNAWTSWVFDEPQIVSKPYQELREVPRWLLSRVWPGRYLTLEDAFHNFATVAVDFCNTFSRHARELSGGECLRTEKFYHIEEWDPPRYARLHEEYLFHVQLVEDLMLELTRAANYVCDKVRECISPSYRLTEGVLLVTSGPYWDLSYHTQRVEYRGEERSARPYPGLEVFKKDRKNRDTYCGRGTSADDPEYRAWRKWQDREPP
jgi:hypothetical protein